jgi:hypothetical protein
MTGHRNEASGSKASQPESPWVDGSQSAAVRRARGRASLTVMHHFTLIVLMATVGVVVVAALPTVNRILSGDPAITARRGIARTMWAKGYAVGPPEATLPHPAMGDGALGAGSPAIGSRRSPSPIGDRRFGQLDLFENLLELDSEPVDDGAKSSGAIAPRDLVLRDQANSDSEPAVVVRRGQILVVVKNDGDWLLLAYKQGDRFELGWAPRDQVLLFP